MTGVAFSPVADAAVVTFSQIIATSEKICVRGAPGWSFSAVAGVGVVASSVLA